MTQRRGLVFGCYDPLHYGHIRLFREAKKHCDQLIVLVHDDDYIRKYKHREPFAPIAERQRDLLDISTVDEVWINPDRSRNDWAHELGVDIVFLSEEVPGDMGITKPTMHLKRTPGIDSTRIRNG